MTAQTSSQRGDEWTPTRSLLGSVSGSRQNSVSHTPSRAKLMTRRFGTDGSVLCFHRNNTSSAATPHSVRISPISVRHSWARRFLTTVAFNGEFFGFYGGLRVSSEPSTGQLPNPDTTAAKRRQHFTRIKPIPWDIFPTEKCVRFSYSLFRGTAAQMS